MAVLSAMDPLTFSNYEVRLRFDVLGPIMTTITVAAEPMSILRETSWMAYRGGDCTCLNSGLDGCQCSGGKVFDKGTVGRVNQYTQDGSVYYINNMSMYMEQGGYWMVFNHSRFYPRAVFIQVDGDMEANMLDVVLLVPRALSTATKSGRIVLNDAAVSSTKVSHSMFLVNSGTPKDKIFWEKRPPDVPAGPIVNSYASQFGEVITLGESYSPLTWALAIYCHG